MPAHVAPRLYQHQNLPQIYSHDPTLRLRELAMKPEQEELPYHVMIAHVIKCFIYR